MDDYRDKDLDGIIEEFSDEIEDSPKRRRGVPDGRAYTDPDRTRNRLLLSGMVVIIAVLGVALYFSLSRQVDEEALQKTSSRFEEIQGKLNTLESRVASVESKMEGLGDSVSKAINRENSFSNRLDILTRDVSKLREEVAKPSKKVEKEEPSPEKEGSAGYHHIVQKGETPYSIAVKYGLSVDELVKLNDLGRNPVIHPGQKLLVKKGGDR